MHRSWKALPFTLALTALPAIAFAQDIPPSSTTSEVVVEQKVAPPEDVPKPLSSSERADLVERVGTLLAGIESEPTAEQWKALGPHTPVVLLEVFQNRGNTVVKRGRAVVALVHFDAPDAGKALREVLSSEVTPKVLQRKIIWTLARLDPAADDVIAPYLGSKNVAVREAAIEALGTLATPAARRALEARQNDEPSAYLQKKIATALQTPLRENAE